MKVILVKDVPSLGTMGNIVKVKDGYARNYLIPRSFAIVANDGNRKELEHRKRVIDARKEKILKETRDLAQKIEKIRVTIQKQTGEEDRIFGSVTSSEIAAFFEQKGIDVSKKDIFFKDEIKKVGIYTAEIKLHQEVTAVVKVKVEAAAKEKE
jgi:large subunit ribosomal protein L9